MSTFLFLALLFSIAIVYSSAASYCVCIEGAGDIALQQDIDYACGAGADCSAILENGNCYQPNTVKSHCDYAVNSCFQNMAQVSGSCNFTGTAIVTNTPPTSTVSGCIFPAGSSQVSAETPSSSFPSINSSTTTTGSTTFGISPNGADSTIIPDESGSPMDNVKPVSTTLMIVICQCVWFYGLERRPFLH